MKKLDNNISIKLGRDEDTTAGEESKKNQKILSFQLFSQGKVICQIGEEDISRAVANILCVCFVLI